LFINSFTYAVIGRVVFGICSGVIPIGKAVLIEILPIEKAPSAIALTTAMWYLGNFIGPFIGAASY
jgi:MFS family permease